MIQYNLSVANPAGLAIRVMRNSGRQHGGPTIENAAIPTTATLMYKASQITFVVVSGDT